MKFRSYKPETIEPEIRTFWKEQQLHKQLRKRIDDTTKKPFYFLDGPPYTSGQVHIGTAWNKTMKDLVVRMRRMQGYAVWDRAGYDMHGLPNENATMKELGLKTNEDIFAYGLDEFIQACMKRGQENLDAMNKDFERIGVSLNFEDAYQTISEEWMQTVWWLIKTAYTNDRLYQGKRPMAWDPVHESALAKHELEYKEVEDTSIYTKFACKNKDNEYFITWTTTPWTIPFNLMIMANPELEYAKIQIENEIWIVAKELAHEVCEAAQVPCNIVETVLGEELIGTEYTHFFADELDYQSLKHKHPNVHTIVASKEYVTTQAGSGLVHAAPGCGPEDYEVGIEYDVPAWNLLTSKGVYPKEAGIFANKQARVEDDFFVQAIKNTGHLVAEKQYVHDYPHAQRSKAAVVYKATNQWFFKVDDIKEEMIAANNQVHWNPQAGYNAFNSWLENLRDNSITKQRFFGTPMPLWISEDGDIIVVESKQELQELSGQTITSMHKPHIDNITITKNNKTYKRIPDVVDVWVDAGVASFACLHYPHRKDLFERFWPADFIIEGNDQVRGWFNLLMVTSFLTKKQAPFKNVYMHGMIQDASGRKMSKSLGNYITPDEVIDAYGADASRLYFMHQTRAGNDMAYNHEDCQQKQRDLFVYWNIHKYLLDLSQQQTDKPIDLQIEDRYILSKAHSALQQAQQALENYALEEIASTAQNLLNEISRTYIQFIRSRKDTSTVYTVLKQVYTIALQLLAPITPYITEAIWQNLTEIRDEATNSIHASQYPQVNTEYIDEQLEEEFEQAQRVISSILAARDQAQIGVRWPLPQAHVASPKTLSEEITQIICEHTNIKDIVYVQDLELEISVAPNYRNIGKEFGQETGDIAQYILDNAQQLAQEFADTQEITVLDHKLNKQHLEITENAPEGYTFGEDMQTKVLLDTHQDQELINEGYAREFVRRVQQARKDADMQKSDEIVLVVDSKLQELLEGYADEIQTQVGAANIEFGDASTLAHYVTDTVKEQEFIFGLEKKA